MCWAGAFWARRRACSWPVPCRNGPAMCYRAWANNCRWWRAGSWPGATPWSPACCARCSWPSSPNGWPPGPTRSTCPGPETIHPLPAPVVPMSSTTTEFAPGLVVQGITPPLSLKNYKLIAFDMDSTLINIECVDEIADFVGCKAEVAAITEAAMQGVITDFKDSLRQRVALLKGVTMADLERVYSERLRINTGPAELERACRAAGLKTLLVSGGFTFFAHRVREQLGIDFARANVLEVRSSRSEERRVGKECRSRWSPYH